MKGIILAAGRGERLGDLTESQPKCFTVLKGKPLIQWQLQALQSAGIHDIAIVTGFQSQCFKYDLTYFPNSQWADSNMVISLLTASSWLEKEACIVSYSDIVYSADVVQSLQAAPGNIAISYDPSWLDLWQLRFQNPLDDAETFQTKNGCLLEIGAQPESVKSVEGQYMGLLKITPAGWQQITDCLATLTFPAQKQLDMTGLLRKMIGEGTEVMTVPIKDRWFEVDSKSDLACYEALHLNEFPSLN